MGSCMKSLRTAAARVLEHALPWLILVILLAYSYADFFGHAHGFHWRASDGTISRIYVNEREPSIHLQDRLIKVGQTDLRSFQTDLRKDLFEGLKPGQVVPITVQRGDQVFTVQWRMPHASSAEVQDELFSGWFLAYFFWLAGTLTILVIRPRDTRWVLMWAFDFSTAIWLIASSGPSSYHVWYSALVFRAAVWISVPVYLHLNWTFPRPLGKLPPVVVWLVYAIAAAFAVAQWLQAVPPGWYLIALVLAVVGCLVLLSVHFARQPDIRRDLGFLLIVAALAIVPSLTLTVATLIRHSTPPLAGLTLLSFPMLPFAYLFAAFRRQLGGLEVRVNRVISVYAFVILLGALMVPLLAIASRLPVYTSDQTFVIAVAAASVATALAMWVYPWLERVVERRMLGIAVPSRELQQHYSSQITSSTTFSDLTRLLNEEMIPSLLVRQFVFLVLDGGSARVLLNCGVPQSQIPLEGAQDLLWSLSGRLPPQPPTPEPRLAWIRLVLSLRVEEQLLGFWLFGRRDPDDLYSSLEIPVLQSFANQTAVALSNILQSERLRAMYQADINRHEHERLSLARDLHDSVLNELAGMLMNADMAALPRGFQDGYRALTQRLREIVSDLRPPMLNYGLKPAIEELAENLMERSKDTVSIHVSLESDGTRYPLEQEQHLFRIVQEGCENAVRHSHGKRIMVLGRLGQDQLELNIVDDGTGFDLGRGETELYGLLSEGHYGLAGMFERAQLIDAQIHIASTPGSGTIISIGWHAGTKPMSI